MITRFRLYEINKEILNKSKIGRDFLKYKDLGKKQPSIDELLDWRNRLDQKYKGEFPDYVKVEIDAVDEILKNLNEGIMNLEIENIIEDNNEELTKKVIEEFSFIIYKQRKRPKNVRVKKLEGYYNKRDFKNYNLIYKTKIIIELSNFDIVEGELSVYENNNDNNIKIKIDDRVIYNLDNPTFDNKKLVDKMKLLYKKHLEKNYKIK